MAPSRRRWVGRTGWKIPPTFHQQTRWAAPASPQQRQAEDRTCSAAVHRKRGAAIDCWTKRVIAVQRTAGPEVRQHLVHEPSAAVWRNIQRLPKVGASAARTQQRYRGHVPGYKAGPGSSAEDQPIRPPSLAPCGRPSTASPCLDLVDGSLPPGRRAPSSAPGRSEGLDRGDLAYPWVSGVLPRRRSRRPPVGDRPEERLICQTLETCPTDQPGFAHQRVVPPRRAAGRIHHLLPVLVAVACSSGPRALQSTIAKGLHQVFTIGAQDLQPRTQQRSSAGGRHRGSLSLIRRASPVAGAELRPDQA